MHYHVTCFRGEKVGSLSAASYSSRRETSENTASNCGDSTPRFRGPWTALERRHLETGATDYHLSEKDTPLPQLIGTCSSPKEHAWHRERMITLKLPTIIISMVRKSIRPTPRPLEPNLRLPACSLNPT